MPGVPAASQPHSWLCMEDLRWPRRRKRLRKKQLRRKQPRRKQLRKKLPRKKQLRKKLLRKKPRRKKLSERDNKRIFSFEVLSQSYNKQEAAESIRPLLLFDTKPKKQLRDVIGRGFVLTRKQMLSPTDKGGARQHAVAEPTRSQIRGCVSVGQKR